MSLKISCVLFWFKYLVIDVIYMIKLILILKKGFVLYTYSITIKNNLKFQIVSFCIYKFEVTKGKYIIK